MSRPRGADRNVYQYDKSVYEGFKGMRKDLGEAGNIVGKEIGKAEKKEERVVVADSRKGGKVWLKK